MAGRKIFLAKTNWSFYETSSLFLSNFTHSLRLNCHSACPLSQEHYSPRGQAVSTSHFCVHVQRRFALAKRFCKFGGQNPPLTPRSQKNHDFRISTANLQSTITFSVSHGSSWGVACANDSWRRLVLLESNTLYASGHVEWQFRHNLFSKMTRRDGLSSLKSNILSAVGMLSCSWGGNYVTRRDGLSSWRVIFYWQRACWVATEAQTMYKIWIEKWRFRMEAPIRFR